LKSEGNIRRIFVAIPVPGKIKEAIFRIREANQAHKRLVWTKECNLHLTLYFIGNTKLENIPAITEIVRGLAASEDPFELAFENISLTPPLKKPRMVWLRFVRSEFFTDLSNRIHLSLRKFIPENPFHFRQPVPHITLVRFNSTFDSSQLSLNLPLEIPAIKVEHCELWESIQTNEGVKYIPIEKFPMRQYS
jgi:2'-5' RNA ligase